MYFAKSNTAVFWHGKIHKLKNITGKLRFNEIQLTKTKHLLSPKIKKNPKIQKKKKTTLNNQRKNNKNKILKRSVNLNNILFKKIRNMLHVSISQFSLYTQKYVQCKQVKHFL